MNFDQTEFRENPPTLLGSFDAQTNQTYFPPRPYSADGKLTETTLVELSNRGTLYSWTAMRDIHFGQITLPEGILIQCELEPGDHEIGAQYELFFVPETEGDVKKWRFRRA